MEETSSALVHQLVIALMIDPLALREDLQRMFTLECTIGICNGKILTIYLKDFCSIRK